eukprot:CAMPEP_0204592128 /NCGR_PEP_ID=MMETSP0661-20131031/50760_1 /ASSEMBLY_ACC=CAM_ASM_000606 /TAXON_ID=109239 /ORGANISM="Alexandrium margalefi, Strain AMGDE01CS-322" /LENGTH=493 /DNA_ID=CAMNT_0051602315 /DNA_START=23 /DNA_END=1501 /DNA_ORIENTATION=-
MSPRPFASSGGGAALRGEERLPALHLPVPAVALLRLPVLHLGRDPVGVALLPGLQPVQGHEEVSSASERVPVQGPQLLREHGGTIGEVPPVLVLAVDVVAGVYGQAEAEPLLLVVVAGAVGLLILVLLLELPAVRREEVQRHVAAGQQAEAGGEDEQQLGNVEVVDGPLNVHVYEDAVAVDEHARLAVERGLLLDLLVGLEGQFADAVDVVHALAGGPEGRPPPVPPVGVLDVDLQRDARAAPGLAVHVRVLLEVHPGHCEEVAHRDDVAESEAEEVHLPVAQPPWPIGGVVAAALLLLQRGPQAAAATCPVAALHAAGDLLLAAAPVQARVVADLPVADKVVGSPTPYGTPRQVLGRQGEGRLDEQGEALDVRDVDALRLPGDELVDVLALLGGVRAAVAAGLLRHLGDPRGYHGGEVLQATGVHLLLVQVPAGHPAPGLGALIFVRGRGPVGEAVVQLAERRVVRLAVGVVGVAVVLRRALQLQPRHARRP